MKLTIKIENIEHTLEVDADSYAVMEVEGNKISDEFGALYTDLLAETRHQYDIDMAIDDEIKRRESEVNII